MIPGMIVALNGKAWTVGTLTSTALTGHGGIPVAANLYGLRRMVGYRVYTEWVTSALGDRLGISRDQWPSPTPLPECENCGARVGYGCVSSCIVGDDFRAASTEPVALVTTDSYGRARDPQELPDADTAATLAVVYGDEEAHHLMGEEPPL